mgnify:CR=1 FL=1
MKYKIVALETFAIIVSYIILFMPMSFALNINIYLHGTSSQLGSASINPDAAVRAIVSTSGDNNVTISVSNKTSKQVIRTVIYKCRGLDPASCLSSVTPESIAGNMQKTYAWSELADTTAAYPQTGHIILLAEVAGAGSEWYGYHYICLLYTSPSPRDLSTSRMPSSA